MKSQVILQGLPPEMFAPWRDRLDALIGEIAALDEAYAQESGEAYDEDDAMEAILEKMEERHVPETDEDGMRMMCLIDAYLENK